MADVVVVPDGATPTFQDFTPQAHSQGSINGSRSRAADGGHVAKAEKLGSVGKSKGSAHTPRTSRGPRPALSIGSIVNGSVDAKIDPGYLISAVLQGEKLNGVLYHVDPDQHVKQFARVDAPDLIGTAISSLNNRTLRRRYRRRKEDRKFPKKNRTGYNFFFAEERLRLKEAFPQMRAEKEITQAIAGAWNNLSKEQREPYRELAVKDKERYEAEIRKYIVDSQQKSEPLNEGTSTKADESKPLGADGANSRA